jgi:hypothetical protein
MARIPDHRPICVSAAVALGGLVELSGFMIADAKILLENGDRIEIASLALEGERLVEINDCLLRVP